MSAIASILMALLNLAYVGLLPRIFFRRDGRFHARWLATAAPFIGASVTLGLGLLGRVQPIFHVGGAAALALHLSSMLASASSMALIRWTTRTHRAPLALWHQENDAPESIVTRGPYAQARHPFYSAFLLTLVAAVLAFPNALTFLCLAYGAIVLNLTAHREELRLLGSRFGREYAAYRDSTGRFFPRQGMQS